MSNIGKQMKEHISGTMERLEGVIDNREDLSTALIFASGIYVQPRYGLSENWVEISEVEAEYLVGGTDDIHARVEDGKVFLG